MSQAITKAGIASIDRAIPIIRDAILKAKDHAEKSVRLALYAGAVMNEAKALLPHGDFEKWIEETFPEVSYDTKLRWRKSAANVIEASGIALKQLTCPASELFAPHASPGASADTHEARQLLFDFTADKTIKECLAAVVVDGDDAHRITRAHNGRMTGGHKGEDRKNWPQFIGTHLSDITAHLKFWKSFTGAMIETVEAKFKAALAKWPTPLLEAIKKLITEELKTR